MGTVLIRPFEKADKPALIGIFKRNVPLYFDPKEIKDFEEDMETDHVTYLTVLLDGKIVGGFGHPMTNDDTIGHITWIFFDPDSAGKGLGAKAIQHCLDLFRKVPTLEKLIVTTSQFAYLFFEKFGFKIIRTEKDYWGKGFDLYWMEMDLN